MSLVGKAISKMNDARNGFSYTYLPFFIGEEKIFETKQNINVDEQLRFSSRQKSYDKKWKIILAQTQMIKEDQTKQPISHL